MSCVEVPLLIKKRVQKECRDIKAVFRHGRCTKYSRLSLLMLALGDDDFGIIKTE